MESTMTITRKITLYPQGDTAEVNRVYKYLRDGMEVQSQMMNQYMSALYSAAMNKVSKEELKEIKQMHSRIPTSKKGSAYSFDMNKYPTGLPLVGGIPYICDPKFKKACKDGLLYGNVSLPTFKKDAPLSIHNDYVNIRGSKKRDTGLYHDYESPMDLVEGLMNDKTPKIHIKFANNITFDIILGNPHKSKELRSVLLKAFEGEYKICDSSIGFDKRTGKKIILNLSLQIPIETGAKDENVTVGVDLGLVVPAVCGLSNDKYKREMIGSADEFLRQRTKLQKLRQRVQSSLKYCGGGHGRKKKLAHLNKVNIHEREYAKTYNHYVSRKVVDFAIKNNAKYINLENLKGFSKDDKSSFVLRNWSFYELQTMIEYKAKKEGIEVRHIEPAYTSQICSICGKKGERNTQSSFTCTNPDCISHKIYEHGFNADFNGARNIALSSHFTTKESRSVDLEFKEDIENLIKKSTTEDKKIYKFCYLSGKFVDILCEDGYWHNFEVKNIKSKLTDTSLKRIKGRKKEEELVLED